MPPSMHLFVTFSAHCLFPPRRNHRLCPVSRQGPRATDTCRTLSPTWVLDGRPFMISGTPRCHGSGWEEACDAYRLAATRMAPVDVVLPVFNPPPVLLSAPKLRRSMARNMASNRANRSSTETEPRLHYSDHATKSMGCMKPQMPVGTFSSLVS